jgi:sulfatase modifying factor 1
VHLTGKLGTGLVAASLAALLTHCTASRIGLVECNIDSDCGEGRVCSAVRTCVNRTPAPSPCAALGTRAKAGAAGPLLILVDAPIAGDCFWMDQTEVTVGQYKTWLSGLDGAAPSWSAMAACAWKSGDAGEAAPFDPGSPNSECVVPQDEATPFEDDKPIRCVDWCEAQAFCQWADKRLCYDYNTTGQLAPQEATAEWPQACSSGADGAYPFDSTAPGRVCNYDQSQQGCVPTTLGNGHLCGPLPVGSSADCHPAPGAPFDLGGNVSEWTDLCQVAPTADSHCEYHGGSYASIKQDLACISSHNAPRAQRDPTLGFRCCASLTDAERAMLSQ